MIANGFKVITCNHTIIKSDHIPEPTTILLLSAEGEGYILETERWSGCDKRRIEIAIGAKGGRLPIHGGECPSMHPDALA